MKLFYFTLALATCAVMAQAQSFDGSKIGNGLRFVDKDSTFSTQINLRFQTQYLGLYDFDSEEYADQFLIRRYRLKFKGFLYDPRIEYKIELGLSNRDQGSFYNENSGAANIVLDAALKWHFRKNWHLWVGQTKLPGNRERVISSGALQFTERSQLNNRYTLDRDIGIQLHHEHTIGQMVLREIASISMGEGRNVTISNSSNGYDYTVRGEILPFGKFKKKGDYFGSDLMREPKPKLSIGVTYDFNDNNNRERGQLGRFLNTEVDFSTLFIDAMFKYNGFSMMSEYGIRTILDGPHDGIDETGTTRYYYTGEAFNISAGYLLKNNLEFAGRYVYNAPESESIGDKENIYTLNVSKFIAGHTLKIQASASYIDNYTADDALLFIAQMEIGF
ncbi:OprO/OprP family phosphate-selective porin [Reichenbachiella carrageenanivorans]|uniref:OprO/OprP family phosphate-selective porin n=1 Tax=Reichenbachiella carrageenanivorans TaxID=2979869 RepID=A0ABY6CX25_9BACT|nr:OprO/OprP family phosphate-selective porin [Reichenbachiella carrageenanivorans]UXX78477.1 OprO/OprP family phosphate-selective porin [Reichenbachiella carrageenanivorans]